MIYLIADRERPVDTNSANRLAIIRLIDHGGHLIKQLNAVVFTTVRYADDECVLCKKVFYVSELYAKCS